MNSQKTKSVIKTMWQMTKNGSKMTKSVKKSKLLNERKKIENGKNPMFLSVQFLN
jgi:hypothetical protein